MSTTSLRALLAAQLKAQVPALGQNVFETEQFDQAQALGGPTAVIVLGAEPKPTVWGARSFSADVMCWVPEQTGAYTDLDGLNSQVVAALDRTVLQEPTWLAAAGDEPVPYDQAGLLGDLYLIRYAGVGLADVHNQDIQALGRPLKFSCGSLRWAPYDDDPVLLALQRWTQATFPTAQTDPASWLPTDASPLVYWRLDEAYHTDEPYTFDTRWLLGTVKGHVECPNPDARTTWGRQITQALAGTYVFGIPLADPLYGQSYTFAKSIGSAMSADPITQGQIKLGMRYLQVDPQPVQAPPIGIARIEKPVDAVRVPLNTETLDLV